MPLEELRTKIYALTAPRKVPQSKYVSRTFYVMISPSLDHIAYWFHQWFPLTESGLELLYPWITSDQASKEDVLLRTWQQSFDAKTINGLIVKGYRIVDTTNQLIFVADLSEQEAHERIQKVDQIFADLHKKQTGDSLPLFRTGIFLVRPDDRGNNLSNYDEVFAWAQGHLDRLFIVNMSNPRGAMYTDPTDLHFLIGHVLYVLTKGPIDAAIESRTDQYREWLKGNSPSNGWCTGFSGISVLVPIDQIMETILIGKAGELLQEALFQTPLDERVDARVLSFLNKSSLNSAEVFRKELAQNDRYPLLDPFAERQKVGGKTPSKWDLRNPEKFISLVDAIDAGLPGLASENGKIMLQIASKHFEEFRYQLLEEVNAIIAGEVGGFNVAESFLQKLREQIKKLLPKEVSPAQYSDVVPLTRRLAQDVQRGPRRESVSVRTIFLVFTSFLIGWTVLDSSLFTIGLAFLAALTGFIYWNAWTTRIERLVVSIWETLLGKWNSLLDHEETKVMFHKLPEYDATVNEVISQIKSAAERLKEIIDFSQENYLAPAPSGSAFWMYVLNRREDIVKYQKLIDVNLGDLTREYLVSRQPLELWQRLSPKGTSEWNEWEWKLIESAALHLLPHGTQVLELSVCQLLRENELQLDNILELIIRSAEPFLVLKPDEPKGSYAPTVEIQSEGCSDIRSRITKAIENNFRTVQIQDAKSIYRISFYCFSEGVNLESVLV